MRVALSVLRYIFRFAVVFAFVSLVYIALGLTVFNWPRLISDLAVIAVWFVSGDMGQIIKHIKSRR